MKTSLIKKLLLFSPFVLSSFFSNAQEFNPEVKEFLDNFPKKFKNYRMNDSAKINLDVPYNIDEAKFQLVLADLDNDSIDDLLLLYPIRETNRGGNKMRFKSNYPFAYYFSVDGKKKILLDYHLDGLNYNESFPRIRRKSKVKI